MTIGYLHSFETFGAVDGPGVRFVYFFQGCKLRCRYCHNPDTWNEKTYSHALTPKQALDKALRYRDYWGKDGGITASGGEPLLQLEFLTELFSLAKKEGIHTTLDTAGAPFCEKTKAPIDTLMTYTDLVMLDIKEIREENHKRLTGARNDSILAFARYLDALNKPFWIRHVLVPGWTDENEALVALSDFISSLHSVQKVEVLPFHNLAQEKWEKLKIKYTLKETLPPSRERIENAKKILKAT